MFRYLELCFVCLIITTVFVGCDFYRVSEPPQCIPDLISEWKFDDQSGDEATDSRGVNNADLAGGVEKTNLGKSGRALHFDGVDDYVELEGNQDLQFDIGSFTLEAWVQSDSDSTLGLRQHIVGGVFNTPSYQVYLAADGSLGARIQFSSGPEFKAQVEPGIPGNYQLTDLEWHHVVVVFDRDIQEIRRYVDGDLYGQKTEIVNVNSMSDSGQRFSIGANSSSRPIIREAFKGKIDEVRAYRRALTPDEIRKRFSSEKC